jgi:hypothetical protein
MRYRNVVEETARGFVAETEVTKSSRNGFEEDE